MTFYERVRESYNETGKNLYLYDEKMIRVADRSLVMNADKANKAHKQTEKISKVLEEHEIIEKQRNEKVFSEYV